MVRRRDWVYTSRDIALGHCLRRWFPEAYERGMRVLNRKCTRALARATKEAAR
jgi:hypothetical protein